MKILIVCLPFLLNQAGIILILSELHAIIPKRENTSPAEGEWKKQPEEYAYDPKEWKKQNTKGRYTEKILSKDYLITQQEKVG